VLRDAVVIMVAVVQRLCAAEQLARAVVVRRDLVDVHRSINMEVGGSRVLVVQKLAQNLPRTYEETALAARDDGCNRQTETGRNNNEEIARTIVSNDTVPSEPTIHGKRAIRKSGSTDRRKMDSP